MRLKLQTKIFFSRLPQSGTLSSDSEFQKIFTPPSPKQRLILGFTPPPEQRGISLSIAFNNYAQKEIILEIFVIKEMQS